MSKIDSKPYIKEVVIVEGKSDSNKLKSIFNVNTIETSGFNLSKKKIAEILMISKTQEIILFLDPDGPGEKIRKKIMEFLPSAKHCFIKKEDIKDSKKIGVAEADKEAIISAFKNITKFDKSINSISWEEYILLDLVTKNIRLNFCNALKISYCNHKQLFKRLNMLNIDYKKAKGILEEINKLKQ
ncbi:MAG: ribonuclease M5 [Malacoplasma sp.]|nr:ribonuclease M5 [Malacoplasma sp.]